MPVQGVIQHVSSNAESILGYHPAEIERKAFITNVLDSDHERVRLALSAAMNGQKRSLDLTFSRKHSKGAMLRVHFVGHVTLKEGKPCGITGFEHVMSEAEEAAAEAAKEAARAEILRQAGDRGTLSPKPLDGGVLEADGVMDRVMKYTLHELRNAIHALDASGTEVRETAQTLVATLPQAPTDMFESMTDMLLAAKTTNVLVNDVLTLTRLREGALSSLPEEVNIRRSVASEVASISDLTPSKLSLSVADTVPQGITIDEHHVLKLLRNVLLISARLQPDSGGQMYVTVSKAGESHLKFELLDRGTLNGNSTTELLDAAMHDTTVKGTRAQRMSLLLPLVSVLVEQYLYGRFALSESAGIVHFWFTAKFAPVSQRKELELAENFHAGDVPFMVPGVPAAWLGPSAVRPALIDGDISDPTVAPVAPTVSSGLIPGQQSESSKAAAEAGAGGGKLRKVLGIDGDGVGLNLHVLLVDDAKVIRRQAKNFLQQLGCTFEILEDGDQVSGALSGSYRPFDAIVLDILMHRSNGADICRELRTKFQVKAPIIAMTSQTEPGDIKRYYEMGFDVVLPKPFTRSSLGKVLIEGAQRRGGTSRYNRMSARVDVDGAPARRPVGAGAAGGTGISTLPEVSEE